MKVYNVKIVGISPLLQHRYAEETPQKKGEKKSGSRDYSDQLEKALYRDEKGVIYQPASHIEGALIKCASNFQIGGRGKKTYKDLVKSTVFVTPDAIPHEIQSFKSDKRAVVVQRARIIRERPKFDEWALKFKIEIRDDQLPPEVLKEILDYAGQYVGIGDFRPRYGRFIVEKFEPAK